MATTLDMSAGGDRPAAPADTYPNRCARGVFCAGAGIACAVLTTAALALDLNSFRAQHGLRPLSASGASIHDASRRPSGRFVTENAPTSCPASAGASDRLRVVRHGQSAQAARAT